MAYTIAFFGTKPYDESSFNKKNKEFGFHTNSDLMGTINVMGYTTPSNYRPTKTYD